MASNTHKVPHQISFVVTIDGPAASGKSSVSRELAKRLGWRWVSTGAFYRGLAYLADLKKIDFADEARLVSLVYSGEWEIRLTPAKTCVFVGGQDVTEAINQEEVGLLASKISSFPEVRKALLAAQRSLAVPGTGLVAEGRDCGTVVFPAAQVKVYLTARAEARAARRALEQGRDVSQTIDDQKIRDRQDADRKAAPMQAASDAQVIDTSEYSFLEVVEKVQSLVEAQGQLKSL